MNWSGIRFAIGAFALAIAGRVLGLPELVGCGIAGLLLCALAALLVRVRRSPLEVERRVVPPQSTAGDWVAVRLEISNPSRWRAPATTLADPISRQGAADGAGDALVSVAPLAPNGRVEATYRIDTPRRGVITLGPMTIRREDPFGLAAGTLSGPEPATVLVLPKVVTLAAPTGGRTDDPLGTATRTRRAVDSGEDFASLRAYVPGDDLRKVHWATSARPRFADGPQERAAPTAALHDRAGRARRVLHGRVVRARRRGRRQHRGRRHRSRRRDPPGDHLWPRLAGRRRSRTPLPPAPRARSGPACATRFALLERRVARVRRRNPRHRDLDDRRSAAGPPRRRGRRGTITVQVDPTRELSSTWSDARLAAERSR